MKKNVFTQAEFNEIKKLVAAKVLADGTEQKKIRNKIRAIGFHFSQFSSKSGYNVSDVEELVRNGQIKILSSISPSENVSMIVSRAVGAEKNNRKEISKSSGTIDFDKKQFFPFDQLDTKVTSSTGFYCIRLKKDSVLPERYQKILENRGNRILYIGKAEGQSLAGRLSQEILHTSPGTFFRSIGAVLKYTPIPRHLNGKRNQKNYKFSAEATAEIIQWLRNNVEIAVNEWDGDFSVEKELIVKNRPLLNHSYNPEKVAELIEDRERCRAIAIGLKTL